MNDLYNSQNELKIILLQFCERLRRRDLTDEQFDAYFKCILRRLLVLGQRNRKYLRKDIDLFICTVYACILCIQSLS